MRFEWVTVYGFRRWNRARQQNVVSPRKATVAALADMPGCTLIEGTGEQVPSHLVDDDGFYFEPMSASTAGRPRSWSRERERRQG